MRFPFVFPIADHGTTILIVRFCPLLVDVRLVIEIKPFKPVGQDGPIGHR
jgi:hypothetical protein